MQAQAQNGLGTVQKPEDTMFLHKIVKVKPGTRVEEFFEAKCREGVWHKNHHLLAKDTLTSLRKGVWVCEEKMDTPPRYFYGAVGINSNFCFHVVKVSTLGLDGVWLPADQFLVPH
ncbi:MAG: hypothetical protein WCK60_03425 [Candidatus Nomurabacteria bacterium]